MKQIYEHHEGFNELAYKGGVLVYKGVPIMIDYQLIKNLCMQKVFEKQIS